jgi:hypothetical protein
MSVSGSRVAEVRLRLRVPSELASSAPTLRATAERELVVRVLEELERLLHARLGAHRLIRIRRLSLGWRLRPGELVDQQTIEKLAADIANQIVDDVGTLPADERLRPRSERFAVFESSAHTDAVFLADSADGESARWIHTERPDAAAVWEAIVAAGASHIEEVITWLRSMQRLEASLALATPAMQRTIAVIVPAIAPTIELLRARLDAARVVPTSPTVSEQPGAIHSVGADRTVTVVSDVVDEHDPVSTVEVRATEGETVDEDTRDVAVSHRQDMTPTTVPTSIEHAGSDQPHALEDRSHADTGVAGVFYLAGCTLEIDLAERLWAAGIPEGDALAVIAEAIVGDDPGTRWFGGLFDREPRALDVEGWAVTEIVETVQHALGRRLVQLGMTLSARELDRMLDGLADQVTRLPRCSVLAHRLVSRSVAALATIVCARLEVPGSVSVLRDVCVRPGRLVLLDEAVHVVMPHTALDIDHRRAGLDRDPGHVPWLGRSLRIEFAGGEVL